MHINDFAISFAPVSCERAVQFNLAIDEAIERGILTLPSLKRFRGGSRSSPGVTLDIDNLLLVQFPRVCWPSYYYTCVRARDGVVRVSRVARKPSNGPWETEG